MADKLMVHVYLKRHGCSCGVGLRVDEDVVSVHLKRHGYSWALRIGASREAPSQTKRRAAIPPAQDRLGLVEPTLAARRMAPPPTRNQTSLKAPSQARSQIALHFLTQRSSTGPTLDVAFFGFCGIARHFVKHYVKLFKNAAILPSDLLALDTAVAVSSNYTSALNEMALSGITNTAIGLAACSVIRRLRGHRQHRHRPRRLLGHSPPSRPGALVPPQTHAQETCGHACLHQGHV